MVRAGQARTFISSVKGPSKPAVFSNLPYLCSSKIRVPFFELLPNRVRYEMAQTNLPFKVGQTVELRIFEHGFRGAWSRCKILRIYTVKGILYYSLKYLDYEEEEIHETQVFQRFEDEEKEWIMVRPPYPPVYHGNEVHKIEAGQEPLVVVHGSWKVGDLVDWKKDGCYWSGTVLAMKKNDALQVELYPPPRGEGEAYKAWNKDLRPSLEWSLDDGWTLPCTDGRQRECARLVKRANKEKEKIETVKQE